MSIDEIRERWRNVGPWHMGVWSHGGPGGGDPVDWYVGDASDDAVAHSVERYSIPRGIVGRVLALLPSPRRRSQQCDEESFSPTDAECAKGEEDMRRIAAAPTDVAYLLAEVDFLRSLLRDHGIDVPERKP